jgi:single-strand DNA-binding protein
MYDTHVTIVGNVLTAPELRRTKNTGSLVAHFKVASTARRLDRETGQWVDGNSFRVRVNCWRKLAEGVQACLVTGDPVIVVGRLYTRDWTDENNNHRIGYELEAIAVGHDLSRGQGTFTRNRPALSTSAVEEEPGVVRIGGEHTDPVPADQLPASPDDRDFEGFGPVVPAPAADGGGDELLGEDDDLGSATDDLAAGVSLGAAEAGDDEPDSRPDSIEDRPGRGRRRGRTAVPV